jgi:hypothetical protein
MRNLWLFLAAATIIIFVVVGLILLLGARQRDGIEQPKPDTAKTDITDVEATADKLTYSSLGESIYYAGIGSEGREIPYTSGPEWMKTIQEKGCVNCHGADGKGGFPMTTDSKEAPSVTYDSLTSEVHHHGGQVEVHEGRYTDEAIKRAITEGINPSGEELDHMMPRWKMTDAELDELLAYLKGL